jgi:hypothetical protein
VAVEIPDRPRGLADVLDLLGSAAINVEYMYAFVEPRAGSAVVIFRFDEPEKAIATLQKAGVSILPGEKVYGL